MANAYGMVGDLACAYIPMTMIEKLAMNMAMEVKAARSRMKSVIGRLPFPLCSYNVPFMFLRQDAAAHYRPVKNGDGKHFPSDLIGKHIRHLDAGGAAH
jgi:hypothetical protein